MDEPEIVDLKCAVVKAMFDSKLCDAAMADREVQFRGGSGVSADAYDEVFYLLDVSNTSYAPRSATLRLAQLSDFVKKWVGEWLKDTTEISCMLFDAIFETIVAEMVYKKGGRSMQVIGSLDTMFEGMVPETESQCGVQTGRVTERSLPDLIGLHQKSMAHEHHAM